LIPRAGENIVYQYDALGRRVVRQDKKTGRTEFTHDGLDVLQDRVEKFDGTTSTTNYVNGLGIDDKLKQTTGTTSKYFLTDHLGSTVSLSDSNGTVTESATYDSFGNKTGTLSTRYQYTGREQDEATGLMYYRARFYDPQIGRFTSEDPIGLTGGINLYGYVDNNPLAFSDPFGLTGEAELRADRNLYRRDSKFAPPPQPMPSPLPIPAPAPTPQKENCFCDNSGESALKMAQQVVSQYPGSKIETDPATGRRQIVFPDDYNTTTSKLSDLGYYSGFLAYNPFQHAGGKEFRTYGSPGFHFTIEYQKVEFPRTPSGGLISPPIPKQARTIDFHIDCNNPVGQGFWEAYDHFFDFLGQWF
jgi:RHS repeat-associated protein